MNFASDNTAGVAPRVMAALAAANAGHAPSYGGDDLTAALDARFAELFEREVAVFMVATGTAANALSIAALAPPWTAVLASHDAHVMTDECGAVEMFTGGARLVGLDGAHARIDLDGLAARLDSWPGGRPHILQPSAVTVSQASEFGAVWSPDALAALGEIAREHALGVHMDGARFANAVAALDCTPAEASWRAGVDILSFGATKNGAMGAEAIVVFDPALAESLSKRRMRAGQLLSKARFLAAQLLALTEDDYWIELAAHANAAAQTLAKAVATCPGARLAAPVEANEVFAWLPRATIAALKAAGARFYEWPGAGPMGADAAPPDSALARLVASFATTQEETDGFAAVLADTA